MNEVIISGNLTRDVELMTSNNGKSIARFTLAVQKPYNKEQVDFINCVAFEKTAINIEKYTSKGSKVAVSGSLNTGSYEKNGVKINTVTVSARMVEFLGKTEAKTTTKEAAITDMKPVDEDGDLLPF